MKINANSNHKILTKIMDWDLSEITNYVKIENPNLSEKDIIDTAEEYKYFMYLTVLTNNQISIPTKMVDLIWHAHILHTQSYTQFCKKIAGKYVHHKPVPYTLEKFEKNIDEVSELSQLVFGRIVFNFSKQALFKNVNFTCA